MRLLEKIFAEIEEAEKEVDYMLDFCKNYKECVEGNGGTECRKCLIEWLKEDI